jgi:putative transcriptional regulator
MTRLGELLVKKSVNKAEVRRKSGINQSRLSKLSVKLSMKLRAYTLYLIALAVDLEPSEILKQICGNLTLSQ